MYRRGHRAAAGAYPRRSGVTLVDVVKPLQPLGDDFTETLQVALVGHGAGLDAKRQHRIPGVETVDAHLNSALWASLYVA